MSYSIRYGPRLPQEDRRGQMLRFQWMSAAFAWMMVLAVRFLWPEGRRILEIWVSQGAGTDLDRATSALARTVAAGEGWYHGFEVFCRTILELA